MSNELEKVLNLILFTVIEKNIVKYGSEEHLNIINLLNDTKHIEEIKLINNKNIQEAIDIIKNDKRLLNIIVNDIQVDINIL